MLTLLALSATLLGLSQAQPYYDATECRRVEPIVPEDCSKTTQICCEYQGEACADVECPTTTTTTTTADPTTSEPTTASPTTASPTSAAPTTSEPTSATPTTAEPTQTPETTCYCPSPAPITPTTPYPTAKKSKSKGSSSSGNHCGDCDCDKQFKLREIRFIWSGQSNVQMKVFSDGKSNSYPWQSEVCRFSNMQTNQEVICDIQAGSSLSSFENETPFIITGSNGYQCAGQYHTSCSSDIVGERPEQVSGFDLCTDIIVSGWRDGNPNDGNDCDDCIEPCSCLNPRDTTSTTTFEPEFVDIIIGENCYCDNTGSIGSTPTPAPTYYSKKSKKKKGKKGSSGGLGYGDCDCDKTHGMTRLRFLWSGTEDVDIYYRSSGGQLLCKDEGIAMGAESDCDARKNNFAKFSTNTYIQVKRAGTNNNLCSTEVHTSCSSDIVGGYGDGGCGTQLLVTGWSDNAPSGQIFCGPLDDPATCTTDPQWCDDGYDKCDCEGVPLDPAPTDAVNAINYNAAPTDGTYIDDVCFCSTIDETSGLTVDDVDSNIVTKRSKVNGYGYGTCECDIDPNNGRPVGFSALEFVYTGTGVVDLVLYAKEVSDEQIICSFEGVQFGDEMACSIVEDGPMTLNAPIVNKYARFTQWTYVAITDENGQTDIGKMKTGRNMCRDIVGWGFTNYPDVVITGWTDKNGNECNDGFEPCDCGNCDVGYSRAECNAATSCYFDETSNTCEASSVSFYQRQSAANHASYAFALILGIVAFLAF